MFKFYLSASCNQRRGFRRWLRCSWELGVPDSGGIWDRLKGTQWVLGNAPELIVAKVAKPKFLRTATKKSIASGKRVRVHVLAKKVRAIASSQLFRRKSR